MIFAVSNIVLLERKGIIYVAPGGKLRTQYYVRDEKG